ncbi:efflux RND transporter periplasmic adaptor subunit [Mesonia sediminis]|uniref:Efflux RND transporter periplasmic adaptor subunit n=1 Tax=Mesonia sediminis TaxID=1703946 RepID=A0ABW5SC97_9FLAO
MKYILLSLLLFSFTACQKQDKANQEKNVIATDAEHHDDIFLSKKQAEVLNLKLERLQKRNMGQTISVNGTLEVPPQNEASVNSAIGANVQNILVIEGQQVKANEIIAYLQHPDIIELQTTYLKNYNDLIYLKKEYERQKKLYEAGVGSGMNFQKAEADFRAKNGLIKGLIEKLRLLNISVNNLKNGTVQNKVAIKSPINGFIQKVKVKTGQFVAPQTTLFTVIDDHHVHADFLVYEDQAHLVEENQKIKFKIGSSEKEFEAVIFATSKSLEKEANAIHVHAEIKEGDFKFIPGMYLEGRIYLEETMQWAFPNEAIVQEGTKTYVFAVNPNKENYSFEPISVIPQTNDGSHTAVKFLDEQPEQALYAMNNAYYILAESKKGEADHSH